MHRVAERHASALLRERRRRFQILTDHTPLQWMSAQKMDGMLHVCHWALAIQEYDFKIVYRKGSQNANADALSRLQTSPCAATMAIPYHSATELHKAQLRDSTIDKVCRARSQSSTPLMVKAGITTH